MGRRRLVPGTVLLFVDFETTGIDVDDHPIQLGVVATDHELNIKAEEEFLVASRALRAEYQEELDALPDRRNRSRNGKASLFWKPKHSDAGELHCIPAARVLGEGLHEKAVLRRLIEISVLAGWRDSHPVKPVLISDNAHFEGKHLHSLAQMVYQQLDRAAPYYRWFPFHHSVWDISLLLELTGLADAMAGKPHTALKDAQLMVRTVQRAFPRTRMGRVIVEAIEDDQRKLRGE